MFALCERYMTRQTKPPDQWLVLDDGEVPAQCNLGQHHVRLEGHRSMALKLVYAIDHGLIQGDAIAFIEDDDWYHPEWLKWLARRLERFDLVGEGSAIYYNVAQRWWSKCENLRHASLCSMGMRCEYLPHLRNTCLAYESVWLDTRLWQMNCNRHLMLPKDDVRMVYGIKGGPGKAGYSREHRRGSSRHAHADVEMVKLRELLGADASSYEKYGHWEDPIPRTTPMKVEVHILAYNEAALIKYTVRHYRTFADTVIVHDAHSTDNTRNQAIWAGAKVVDWDMPDEFNDFLAMTLKNTCWLESDADFVIPVDADELLWFPEGAEKTLEAYRQANVAMVKPHGFEMFTEIFPTTADQIYDQVKYGAPDDKWYAKPVMFSPVLVADAGIGIGGHCASPILKNGRILEVDESYPFSVPPAYLLHFHQIGPIERIAAVYDARRPRLSKINEEKKWGNFEPGMKHALDKRAYILARIQQVIP